MRNFPLQSSFSGVEIGYPCRVPIIHFNDFTEFGTARDVSLTATQTTTYELGGVGAAVATSVTHRDQASTDGDVGGFIKMLCTGTSGDGAFLQLMASPFLCTTGRQMLMHYRFRLDSITTVTHYFGMNIPTTVGLTTTNPVTTMTNGFGFVIVNGAVNYIIKNATASTNNVATGATIAASTTTGWHDAWARWDGKDAIQFFLDGTLLATSRANIPTGLVLSPVFGLQASSTNVPFMMVDTVYAAVEPPTAGR